MEIEIGTLSIILIVGLLALISIGVPMGFASGFMGAVLVFLYIGEHALGILLSRYYSLVVTYSFLSVPLFIFICAAVVEELTFKEFCNTGYRAYLLRWVGLPTRSTPFLPHSSPRILIISNRLGLHGDAVPWQSG